MISLFIDAFGSYLLIQKTSRWLYLAPLAVLLGIIASFSTNMGMHVIAPEMISATEASVRSVFGSVWHSLVCVIFMWWFRRKKLQNQSTRYL